MDSSETHANGPRSSSADLSQLFGKMQPFIEKLIDIYAIAYPFCAKVGGFLDSGYQKVKPIINKYWRSEYTQLLIGAVLLLFGGTFAMTIACYMAVKLSGW